MLKKDPDSKLLLVGGGDGMLSVQEEVRTMGMQDKVIFTGVRSDVNRLMQVMNVFVFPSIYEGLPVTMIEAQASGLPCIISDCVSNECIITKELVTSMRLEDTPENWADLIIEKSRCKRENHNQEIEDAGYDIMTAAKQLEKFYLENSKE